MEQYEIVVPKKGDELYEGLLEIFKGREELWPSVWNLSVSRLINGDVSDKDKFFLDKGILEAKNCYRGYIKDGELGLDEEIDSYPISLGCYILIWVLLKIQPDGGILEEEKAQRIFDEFNGRNIIYEERNCILFNKCVDLVNRIITQETAFKKAEESLQFAMSNVKNAQNKVRDLKGAVKYGQVRIENQKKQIKTLTDQIGYLENRCEQLKKEKEELRKEMTSGGHQQQVGERYLRKVFEEYLRDADEMEQSLRKDWFNVLQGFCSIEGVPKEVKKMIQLLKRKPKSNDIVTVKAESGATVNNYDIHGNNQVNTNKAD